MSDLKREGRKGRKGVVAVAIMWRTEGVDDQVYVLAYDGGNGLVRTYEKDHYDARCQEIEGEPLPYFSTPHEAYVWMGEHPKKLCQVGISAAVGFGFKRSEFAGVL